MLLATLMLAVALMTTAVSAAELPKGVSVKVLAEFPSAIPGVKRVKLVELRLEPGARMSG